MFLEKEGQLAAAATGRDGLVALLLLDGSVAVDAAFRQKIASVIGALAARACLPPDVAYSGLAPVGGIILSRPLFLRLSAAEVRVGRLLSGLQAAVGAAPANWHIPGFRYLFYDRATGTARASPEGKVATLSADALAAVANLRAEIGDGDDCISGGGGGGGGEAAAAAVAAPGAETCSYGACVRLAHESWVILRQNPRKCLFTVIERNSYTLVDVMEKFELVCATHFGNSV